MDNLNKYIHGYSDYETNRLNNQAETLADLLHHDSVWDEGSIILEAGCGIGAQTKIIAPKNKSSKFVSINISLESINQAWTNSDSNRFDNVVFKQADILELPFADEYFDHIFLSFVLEHIPNPIQALVKLKRVLKQKGTITIIEGDLGSTFFHPDSEAAKKAIQCQSKLQEQNGGDANIGRKLHPLLYQAGFKEIKISPRQVYIDDSNPKWVETFTKNTFTAMIKGVSKEAVSKNLIDIKEFEKGIKDLNRTAEGGGTFSFTFFKGIGTK